MTLGVASGHEHAVVNDEWWLMAWLEGQEHQPKYMENQEKKQRQLY